MNVYVLVAQDNDGYGSQYTRVVGVYSSIGLAKDRAFNEEQRGINRLTEFEWKQYDDELHAKGRRIDVWIIETFEVDTP